MKGLIRIGLVFCALVFALPTHAGPGAVRKQVEMSMLLTGQIEIAADGRVSGHRLDHPEKVPPAVVKLIDQTVGGWRFEPAMFEGTAAATQAKMSLRVVGQRLENGNYTIRIRSAHFDDGNDDAQTVTAARLAPPSYPTAAFQAGITGIVYLVIQVGRDGTVEQVAAEQTNLTVVGSERQMQQGRDLLTRASLQVARRWTFKPPVAGKDAEASSWSVRVPVQFKFEDQRIDQYGQWQAYVPGPRQTVAWLADADNATAPDGVPDMGVNLIGAGPRLLTPLGRG